MTLQAERRKEAMTNIGKHCRWAGEPHVGTIVGVNVAGGWPVYVIEWPDDAPDWWGNTASTHSAVLVIEP